MIRIIALLLSVGSTLVSAQDGATRSTLASLVPASHPLFVEVDRPDRLIQRLRRDPGLALAWSRLKPDQAQLLDAVAQLPIQRLAASFRPAGFLRAPRFLIAIETHDEARLRNFLNGIGQDKLRLVSLPRFGLAIVDGRRTEKELRACFNGKTPGLAASAGYRSLARSMAGGDLRWYANTEALAPKREKLLRPPDAFAALITGVGRLSAALASEVGGSLDLARGIELGVDARVDSFPEANRFLHPHAKAPPVLDPGQPLLARLSLRRDLHAFWQQRDALSGEKAKAAYAAFRSQVGIILGGTSLDEFLLGLGDSLDLFLAPPLQDARSRGFVFPRAALVIPLRGAVETDLVLAFQSAIGLVNLENAQNGEARFILENRRVDGVTLHGCRFPAELLDGDDDPRHQLRPTLAIARGQFILGSDPTLVSALVEAALKKRTTERRANEELSIEGSELCRLFDRNRAWIASRLLLSQGGGPSEVKPLVTGIRNLLREIRRVHLSLSIAEKAHHLALSVERERAERTPR